MCGNLDLMQPNKKKKKKQTLDRRFFKKKKKKRHIDGPQAREKMLQHC